MSTKFSQINLRQLLHPAYRSLETIVHPLRYLFLEITQKCNLKCLHCGSDCSRRAAPSELQTDDWLNFVDYVADNFGHPKPLLVITGGEPLCHSQLDIILERMAQRRLPFGMVTNGYLLNERNVSRLLERGVKSITVSLDGKRQSHDWLRGVPGSFDRAVQGIGYLARSDIPFLDVVTCANPRNLSELTDVSELLYDLGVKRHRIFSIFPKGRAAQNPELFLSDMQLVEMLDWIKMKRTQMKPRGFHLNFSCEGYLPKDVDRAVRDEPYFCRAGICIASVLSDGSISACPNISRSFIQGNIAANDFKETWENKFDQFRDRAWMQKGICLDCNQWNRCRGNSLHLFNDESQQPVLCHHKAIHGASPA